ncbi:putative ATP-dependent RNA helicase DDX28 [Mytilus galloprovincialis]|uniref:putative ATP-dependent RNA helicase DDX28 n=1 Tax=Mytilus galloprovincialis TaxID=29158 RepID=UPI003F7C7FDE
MAYSSRRLQKILILLKQYSTLVGDRELPRITVPQKMMLNLEKQKLKKEIENKKKKIKFKSPLIISCKRSQYNHHKGQTYSEFDPKVLVSHAWKNTKSAGDYFTINSYGKNPALLRDDEIQHFTDFDINPEFLPVLESMNITSPTVIQSKSIAKVLEGENIQIAAETGSGKTLAYLLPIMEMISRQKKSDAKFGAEIPENSPRCIILVPTKELVQQVKVLADKFAAQMDFSVDTMIGSFGTKKKLAYPKKSEIDILISTTGMLRKFLGARIIKPSHVRHLVIDEADTLLDDSFNSEIKYIINKLGVSENIISETSAVGMQLVLVSATMPRSLKTILGDSFPIEDMEKVTTDFLHHLMPHVPQKFLRLKPSQKAEEIVLMSKKLMKKGTPAMIFCNEHARSVWLSRFLKEQSIDNVLMNAGMTPYERKDIFERFQNEENDLLVCTDIASRGLDTVRVEHVINYDFPNFMSDYIHRAGRVGRVGSKYQGLVTSFVTYAWEVDLLWNIETAARKSKELHNVNANIKKKLVGRADKREFEQE